MAEALPYILVVILGGWWWWYSNAVDAARKELDSITDGVKGPEHG